MTNKTPWYEHRGSTYSLTEKEVLEITSELRRLEAETQPSAGHAEGKELASYMAIMAASRLVNALAGWAFNHQIGRVINETLGEPDSGVWVNNQSEFEKRQRAFDEHRHEAAASVCRFEDPVQNRRILAHLFGLNLPGLPGELTTEIATALQAVDFGDTMPLLARSGMSRKKTYRKQALRFSAALHVEYLRGLGHPREDALALVGDAYDRKPETIEGWISDLPSKLGHIMNIADSKHLARAIGERIRRDHSASIDGSYRKGLSRLYDSSALADNGDEYKRIAGHREEEPVIIDFPTT